MYHIFVAAGTQHMKNVLLAAGNRKMVHVEVWFWMTEYRHFQKSADFLYKLVSVTP